MTIDITGEEGSSPHTRGARRVYLLITREHGIIPAYAGSTPSSSAGRCIRRDHPRIRGEHSLCAFLASANLGSSPHTRGAHRLCIEARRVDGIIPAYAGSTLHGRSSYTRTRDHPRIRGEHPLSGD